MLRKGHVLAIIITAASLTTVLSIHAQDESIIPSWIKNTAGFWVSGDISDAEYLSSIEWMIENKLIRISSSEDGEWKRETAKLYNENQRLQGDLAVLEKDVSRLTKELQSLKKNTDSYSGYSAESTSTYTPPPSTQPATPDPRDYCYGSADCFVGYVTKITDGDTIEVDGKSIRFALVNTPEYGEYGYSQATNYIKKICPVGSIAVVDEDDRQTQGSYGRIIALIHCENVPTSLNEAVVGVGLAEISTSFCSKSEFASQAWAQKYGCATSTSQYTPPQPKAPSQSYEPAPQKVRCDPSYPDFCIPPSPPDLDCADIPTKNFTVLYPDPHNFDGDGDGIGCESSSQSTTQPSCDPSYPDVCIPPYPPDLDCGEISHKNFRVVGSDPHRFDGDGDGIGCES